MKLAAFTAALIGSISPAFAGDWYVDAQNGNDANSGLSTADAWKTISRAFAVVPTPPVGQFEAIHIASGTYDAALGETYPLTMRPGLQLLGDPNGRPILDGGQQTFPLVRMWTQTGVPSNFDANTVLRDLVLQRAGIGIWTASNSGVVVTPVFEGLEIREMSSYGILTGSDSSTVHLTLNDLLIEHNSVGLFSGVIGSTQGEGFSLTNSIVRHNDIGVEVNATGAPIGGHSKCQFDGVRVEFNGLGVHVRSSGAGISEVELTNCIVVDNVDAGVVVVADIGTGTATADIRRSTVSRNRIGVYVGDFAAGVTLSETISFGNLEDLRLPVSSPSSAAYCNLGGLPFGSGNGNFVADPLFVAPATGDYSLSPGSPCIDAGNPASPLDPDCSRRDVGAIPFAQVNGAIYCTAKTNSCGSLPAISSVGSPSASATSGFVISTSNAKAGKTGLLLYSVQGRAATPFQGGFLCLAGTIKRSPPLVDTTGTGTNCDGVLGVDMNAFAHGLLGGTPLPALTVAGTRVDCQIWGRDTVGNVLLSDGLEYFVCP
ncbi:MAG: DUF1565 domain-containing protein [Planctomycetes bacterium]|nr:DUF1565 domain-containing protein [Planctomycetota bacterium]